MRKSEKNVLLPKQIQESLLNHDDFKFVLSRLVSYFQRAPEVKGLIVSGSVASGSVDEFSDIDLLVVVSDDGFRDTWLERYKIEASVGKVFFWIDLEEIWPTSSVAFFENGIKVHLTYKAISELEVEDEFRNGIVLFSNESKIDNWLKKCKTACNKTDFLQLMKNDRRFWFWLLQGAAKFGRGEFWAAYDTLHILRNIIIEVHETANKKPFQAYRHIENRWQNRELSMLAGTISGVTQRELSIAYSNILKFYEKIRYDAEKQSGLKWDINRESLQFVKSLVNRWLNKT